MKLQFAGGAGEVTGSSFLIDGRKNILIDCGFFQGEQVSEDKNRQPFPFNPQEVDAVLLTHAHLDHCGRLPSLVKNGFKGPIFTTPPTGALIRLILLDTVHLMIEEMEENGRPPLYTAAEVEETMSLITEVAYNEERDVFGASFKFRDAGHILGSSFIEIETEGKKFVFSGDLGNSPSQILMPPERPESADFVVIEATYGGKEHDDRVSKVAAIHEAVDYIIKTGGTLLIPAFAIERTQEILHILDALETHHAIADIPAFLDSPLAIDVTSIFRTYPDYLRPALASALISGDDDPFDFPKLKLTRSVDASKSLNEMPGPKIVVAGSGMMEGGRIQHHLLHCLSDPKNLLLVVGFQAPGTLGRAIVDGAKRIHIKGYEKEVKAKVVSALSFSSHADNSGLLAWLAELKRPEELFLVHGEPDRLTEFKDSVLKHHHWQVKIPIEGEVVTLG